MNTILNRYRKQSLNVFILLSILLALFSKSHILWSSTVIIYLLFSIANLVSDKKTLSRDLFYWSFILFYIAMLVSGIWAVDGNSFLKSIQMKLILVVLPFCFMINSRVSKADLIIFIRVIFFTVFLSALYVAFNYIVHKEEVLKGILQGQAISVPFKDHIRYSVFLNFCFILGIYQVDFFRKLNRTKEFMIWLITTMILFFYIQFLAVKTGVVLSIFILFSFIAYKIFKKRLFLKGFLSLILIAVSMFIFVKSIPTLQNKLSYFLWDIRQLGTSDYESYSDGGRIASIKQGLQIAKHNFWFGLGEGNIKHSLNWSEKNPVKLPHNQFLIVIAQNGIGGLFLFCSIFFFGIKNSISKKNWMSLTYLVSMFLALMVEPMLETQLGLTIFTVPLLFLYSIDLKAPN